MALAKAQMDMERGKIFGIGFHKTGTTSLTRALTHLGYSAIHGDPRFGPPYGDEGRTLIQYIEAGNYQLPTIEHYDVFTDNPYFTIWKELVEHYPDSKFILTIRDEAKWIKSCINYYRNRRIRPMRRWMFGPFANPAESEEAQQVWLQAYRAHNKAILEYFKDRPDDLLVIDVTAGEGWEKLCPFLGHPIPKDSFPMANTFKSKQKNMNKDFKRQVKRTRQSIKRQLRKLGDRLIGRKTVYIISHPKSGRTWLGIALGKVLEELYGIPHHTVIQPYDYFLLNKPALPRIIFTHLFTNKSKDNENFFNPKGKNVVLLVRDPRDLIVSYFHQMTNRKKKFDGDISTFIRSEERGIKKVLRFMNFFAKNRTQFANFHLLTYEGMHENMVKELTQICEILGLNASPATIENAVEWSKFDKMQAREKEGFYAKKVTVLNAKNLKSIDTFKARKGKVGSYDEELSTEDIDYINQQVDLHLHEDYSFYK